MPVKNWYTARLNNSSLAGRILMILFLLAKSKHYVTFDTLKPKKLATFFYFFEVFPRGLLDALDSLVKAKFCKRRWTVVHIP